MKSLESNELAGLRVRAGCVTVTEPVTGAERARGLGNGVTAAGPCGARTQEGARIASEVRGSRAALQRGARARRPRRGCRRAAPGEGGPHPAHPPLTELHQRVEEAGDRH